MKGDKKIALLKGFTLFAITMVFSLLTYFVDRQPVGYEGTSVGFATLNSGFSKVFGYNQIMDIISDLAMYTAFLVVVYFAVMGLAQLLRGKSITKVNKAIVGLGILYFIVAVIYVAFKKIPINYRPILQPGETEIETSFPSTHTLVITTVFGSAILAFRALLTDKKAIRSLTILLVIFMVVGVVARLFAGVHWVTDIIAGLLFSATLISFYAACSMD